MVGYDWHGGYGHPDHVKVHHLVHRGAELAASRPRVLESTMNRDLVRRMFEAAKAAGMADDQLGPGRAHGRRQPPRHARGGDPPGRSTSAPTCTSGARRCEAHASQATDIGAFLGMPDDVFEMFFGAEHYIERGREPGMRRGWFFED